MGDPGRRRPKGPKKMKKPTTRQPTDKEMWLQTEMLATKKNVHCEEIPKVTGGKVLMCGSLDLSGLTQNGRPREPLLCLENNTICRAPEATNPKPYYKGQFRAVGDYDPEVMKVPKLTRKGEIVMVSEGVDPNAPWILKASENGPHDDPNWEFFAIKPSKPEEVPLWWNDEPNPGQVLVRRKKETDTMIGPKIFIEEARVDITSAMNMLMFQVFKYANIKDLDNGHWKRNHYVGGSQWNPSTEVEEEMYQRGGFDWRKVALQFGEELFDTYKLKEIAPTLEMLINPHKKKAHYPLQSAMEKSYCIHYEIVRSKYGKQLGKIPALDPNLPVLRWQDGTDQNPYVPVKVPRDTIIGKLIDIVNEAWSEEKRKKMILQLELQLNKPGISQKFEVSKSAMRTLERKTKEMEKSRKALIKKGQAFAKAELGAIQARNKLTFKKVSDETESDDSQMEFSDTPPEPFHKRKRTSTPTGEEIEIFNLAEQTLDKTVADVAAVFRQKSERNSRAIEEIANVVHGESREARSKETIRGITGMMRTMVLPPSRVGDKHPKGYKLMNDLLRGVVSEFAKMIDARLEEADTTEESVIQDLELTDIVEETLNLSAVEDKSHDDSSAQDGSAESMEDELEVGVSPDEWKNWLREATAGGTDGPEVLTDEDEPMENNNEDGQETKDTSPKE